MEIIGYAILSAFTLAMLGVWIGALYRAATCQCLAARERGMWVVFIAVFNIVGAFAYFLATDALSKHQHSADHAKDHAGWPR